MAGPSRTARALRVIAGTDRADRPDPTQIKAKPLSVMPEPSEEVARYPRALRDWNSLGPTLIKYGLLTDLDVQTFEHFCLLQADIWALRDPLLSGASLKGRGYGSYMTEYRSLGALFGLSPAWRSKIKPSSEAEKQNPFARLDKPR